jgi:hypothetical protein
MKKIFGKSSPTVPITISACIAAGTVPAPPPQEPLVVDVTIH